MSPFEFMHKNIGDENPVISAKAHLRQQVKPYRGEPESQQAHFERASSMRVIIHAPVSAKAHLHQQVKPYRGGRSQNQQPVRRTFA